MKFGIILPIWRLSVGDAERLTCRAEELGWDGVFIPDHVVAMPATVEHYGPSWPDPLSLLAYLAGKTSRILLGTSVIVLPYRHPLAVAKAAATVDQVSGGRFICGVGVGWDEAEFQVLKIPFHERGRLSDEYLALMQAAWSAETFDFDGRYFSFQRVGFAPRPVQQPRPPVWVASALRGSCWLRRVSRRYRPNVMRLPPPWVKVPQCLPGNTMPAGCQSASP